MNRDSAATSRPQGASDATALRRVKLLHTIVWAIFVVCIVAIPPLAWFDQFAAVVWLSAAVFGEVLVLALNGWRCPLTPIAARFTAERRDNFDIYLPEWLARYNKQIFGTLFVCGELWAIALWLWRRAP